MGDIEREQKMREKLSFTRRVDNKTIERLPLDIVEDRGGEEKREQDRQQTER